MTRSIKILTILLAVAFLSIGINVAQEKTDDYKKQEGSFDQYNLRRSPKIRIEQEKTFKFKRPQGGMNPNSSQKDKMKMMQTMKLVYIIQNLDLSEEQTIKFMAKYSNFEKSRKEFSKRQREQQKKLKKLLKNPETPEKEIAEKIKELFNIQEKFKAEQKETRKKLLSELSVRQQAKFILLQHKMHKQIRNTFRKFMGDKDDQNRFQNRQRQGEKRQ